MLARVIGEKVLLQMQKEGSNLSNMLTLNGKYQIVEMNKSWWLKHQKNIDETSLFWEYLNDEKKSQMTAQMIYQPNEYLILVPWVKKRHCRAPEPKTEEVKPEAAEGKGEGEGTGEAATKAADGEKP